MLNALALSALEGHVGQTVVVSAWVLACQTKVLDDEGSLTQLRLAAGGCSVQGFIWPEHQKDLGTIESGTAVTLKGRVRRFGDQLQLQIQRMRPATLGDVSSVAGLLPCVNRRDDVATALARLQKLERNLAAPLQGFLKDLLLDPRIGLPLVRCRGSESHHHAYPGGLLVHSTELLDAAALLSRSSMPNDPLAAPMAQLGYLLHDLGKLRSLGERGRPVDPFVLRHETMTVELLAPHLARLDGQDRELGLGLRYVLEYLATPPASRPKIAPYLVAEIVAFLDRCSAASHHRRDLGSLLRRRPRAWDVISAADADAANDGAFNSGFMREQTVGITRR